MTGRNALVASIAVAIAVQTGVRAEPAAAGPIAPAKQPAGAEQHHYTIGARVRPLLLFWITRRDVGDAVVTRHRAPGEALYSLLIGTDPQRTPMHINRWGYIEEEMRGAEARLLGVMTESEEASIQQAEANVRGQAAGTHPFRVIQATADGAEARARVASIHAPEDYTVRQISAVLDLVERETDNGRLRVTKLSPGTRPGFLAALADAMHSPFERSINYVYYGRLYELRLTRSRTVPDLQIGHRSYGPAVTADFVITSAHDGEQTKFSMTFGTRGRFAEVPLTVAYQPRWWMEIELTIDEPADAATAGGEVAR
jgi:hypothetical protein